MNCPHCNGTVEKNEYFCSSCGGLVGTFSELHFEETDLAFLRADISGFTSLCESMQAEEVMSFLNDVFMIFANITEKYKGTVYQIIGDEMVSVFGLHKGSGFSHHMAVMSGEEMILKLREYAAGGKRKSIGLKIGCEIDRVKVLSIQESWQNSYLITEGFAKAQILQKNAEENSIYVGENLYQATKSFFEYQEIGEFIKDNLSVKAYRYSVAGK